MEDLEMSDEKYNMIINFSWVSRHLMIFIYYYFIFRLTKSFVNHVKTKYIKAEGCKTKKKFLLIFLFFGHVWISCATIAFFFALLMPGNELNLFTSTMLVSITYSTVTLVKYLFWDITDFNLLM